MTDNILAIIVLPLLIAIAAIASFLHLISDLISRVARLLRDKGAPVEAGSADEDLLSQRHSFHL